MNKKLLAVAVLGALAAPEFAFAQASTVQIYGTLRQTWSSWDQGGQAATPSNANAKVRKDAITDTGGSNIGFRGTESLGGGMNAWFQLETTSDLSNGGAGTAGQTVNAWGDRNSAVGLNGGWGSVLFGNWDTPLNWSRVSGYTNDNTNIIGINAIMGNGAGRNCANASSASCTYSFFRRQQNSVQYWTPNVGGFEGRFGMSAAEEKAYYQTVAGAQVPAANTVNGFPVGVATVTTLGGTAAAGAAQVNGPIGSTATPRIWSLGGQYKNGPLQLNAGYERHSDFTRTGGNDNGWDIGGTYRFGDSFLLSGIYERLSYDLGTTAAPVDLSRNSWALMGDWNIAGPHSLLGGYVKANSTGGSAGSPTAILILAGAGNSNIVANGGGGNTGSQMWYLRYKYAFSKRTYVHADYAQINNDSFAISGLHISTLGGNSGSPNAGQRQNAYGIGITHTF